MGLARLESGGADGEKWRNVRRWWQTAAVRLILKVRSLLLLPQDTILSEREDLRGFAIGRWSYGGLQVLRWTRNGTLSIGAFCSFAENTMILLGGEHNYRSVTTFPMGHFIGGVAADAHERSK